MSLEYRIHPNKNPPIVIVGQTHSHIPLATPCRYPNDSKTNEQKKIALLMPIQGYVWSGMTVTRVSVFHELKF